MSARFPSFLSHGPLVSPPLSASPPRAQSHRSTRQRSLHEPPKDARHGARPPPVSVAPSVAPASRIRRDVIETLPEPLDSSPVARPTNRAAAAPPAWTRTSDAAPSLVPRRLCTRPPAPPSRPRGLAGTCDRSPRSARPSQPPPPAGLATRRSHETLSARSAFSTRPPRRLAPRRARPPPFV